MIPKLLDNNGIDSDKVVIKLSICGINIIVDTINKQQDP